MKIDQTQKCIGCMERISVRRFAVDAAQWNGRAERCKKCARKLRLQDPEHFDHDTETA